MLRRLAASRVYVFGTRSIDASSIAMSFSSAPNVYVTVVGSGTSFPFSDEGLYFTPMMNSPSVGSVPVAVPSGHDGRPLLHHLASESTMYMFPPSPAT